MPRLAAAAAGLPPAAPPPERVRVTLAGAEAEGGASQVPPLGHIPVADDIIANMQGVADALRARVEESAAATTSTVSAAEQQRVAAARVKKPRNQTGVAACSIPLQMAKKQAVAELPSSEMWQITSRGRRQIRA